MPYVSGGLLKAPARTRGEKFKDATEALKKNPRLKGVKNKARTKFGNATSTRATTPGGSRKFGQPTGNVKSETADRRVTQSSAAMMSTLAGLGAGTYIGAAALDPKNRKIAGRQKQIKTNNRKLKEFGKARFLITDAGTRGEKLYNKAQSWDTRKQSAIGAPVGLATAAGLTGFVNHRQNKKLKSQTKTLARQNMKLKEIQKMSSHSAFGVDHGSEISKKEPPKASGGRQALGGTLGIAHGAFAGKKGHKLRAMANQGIGAYVGGDAGKLVGALATKGSVTGTHLGGLTGSVGGAVAGTRRAQAKGHFKPEKKR